MGGRAEEGGISLASGWQMDETLAEVQALAEGGLGCCTVVQSHESCVREVCRGDRWMRGGTGVSETTDDSVYKEAERSRKVYSLPPASALPCPHMGSHAALTTLQACYQRVTSY